MKIYNGLLNYVSNCDDIYCPHHNNCSTDCEECVNCYNENENVL